MQDLYIAIACSSNMNRSMEAHAFLAKKGFKVKSFGTGDRVRLPGRTRDHPNCYEFGTPYKNIYQDLLNRDREFYTQIGLLNMLERNRRVKLCPERFQDCKEIFDVIITCEDRIFDRVIAWFTSRDPVINKPVHVVNINIADNAEEATIGSFLISDIVSSLAQSRDLDNDVDSLLHAFEIKTEKPILHCVMSY